jgi:hypothetical protein
MRVKQQYADETLFKPYFAGAVGVVVTGRYTGQVVRYLPEIVKEKAYVRMCSRY